MDDNDANSKNITDDRDEHQRFDILEICLLYAFFHGREALLSLFKYFWVFLMLSRNLYIALFAYSQE